MSDLGLSDVHVAGPVWGAPGRKRRPLRLPYRRAPVVIQKLSLGGLAARIGGGVLSAAQLAERSIAGKASAAARHAHAGINYTAKNPWKSTAALLGGYGAVGAGTAAVDPHKAGSLGEQNAETWSRRLGYLGSALGGLAGGVAGGGVASLATSTAGSYLGESLGERLAYSALGQRGTMFSRFAHGIPESDLTSSVGSSVGSTLASRLFHTGTKALGRFGGIPGRVAAETAGYLAGDEGAKALFGEGTPAGEGAHQLHEAAARGAHAMPRFSARAAEFSDYPRPSFAKRDLSEAEHAERVAAGKASGAARGHAGGLPWYAPSNLALGALAGAGAVGLSLFAHGRFAREAGKRAYRLAARGLAADAQPLSHASANATMHAAAEANTFASRRMGRSTDDLRAAADRAKTIAADLSTQITDNANTLFRTRPTVDTSLATRLATAAGRVKTKVTRRIIRPDRNPLLAAAGVRQPKRKVHITTERSLTKPKTPDQVTLRGAQDRGKQVNQQELMRLHSAATIAQHAAEGELAQRLAGTAPGSTAGILRARGKELRGSIKGLNDAEQAHRSSMRASIGNLLQRHGSIMKPTERGKWLDRLARQDTRQPLPPDSLLTRLSNGKEVDRGPSYMMGHSVSAEHVLNPEQRLMALEAQGTRVFGSGQKQQFQRVKPRRGDNPDALSSGQTPARTVRPALFSSGRIQYDASRGISRVDVERASRSLAEHGIKLRTNDPRVDTLAARLAEGRQWHRDNVVTGPRHGTIRSAHFGSIK